MALRTYDAKKVIITIGSHTVTGYADGSFITIEPEGDGTVAQAGADGEVARSLSNNPLHSVSITLQQTSPSNDALSELLRRDKASGGGGVVPLQVRDLRGTSLFAASQAWVVNWPSTEYGAELNDREWPIMAVMTDMNVGGNNE